MNKGIAGIIVVVIAGAFVTLLAMIATILPVFTLRVHFIETIYFENNYNNAQLGLLTLLASTDRTGKSVQEILSEYDIDQSPAYLDTIKNKLDLLSANMIFNCYELKVDGESVAKSDKCTPSKYSASAAIAAPYSQYKRAVELVID